MQTVLEAIATQAAERPRATALCRAGHCLTHGELDARASGVAAALVDAGVRRGDAVAVCLPRGFDQVVSALGAMRAGAAYVPCDPAWPKERVRAVVADAGAAVVLARREMESEFGGVRVVDPAEVSAIGQQLAMTMDADDLAYLIYTSGSTGTPKGVEITHGNLAHLIAWHTAAFEVTTADRGSHLAGLGFDASVWEVWPYLAAGATVVLAFDAVRSSPELLLDWLVEERITVGFVPTPLAEPMLGMSWPSETRLRYLLAGGDALHGAPGAELPFAVVNSYGPTECTVVATSGVVAPGGEGMPSIGRPICGANAYVLDAERKPVAEGVTGELWIGGSGVGRGYRGLPEQTAASFMPDTVLGGAGARMYRTGDLAAMLPSGELAFHGRVDGQVKIRGQRLELDEIVCVLNRHPGVAASAVAALGEGAEKRLVGYVVAKNAAPLTARELREFLAGTLPGYMVPAIYVALERLPLNASGKLDRSALPPPSEENRLVEESARGPGTPVEEVVLRIVRQLVKSDEVGIEDDFFLVGGHSLMGTQLIMRVRESFGVPLTLRDLFEGATVARLSARVEALLMAEMEAMSEEEAMRQVAERQVAERQVTEKQVAA